LLPPHPSGRESFGMLLQEEREKETLGKPPPADIPAACTAFLPSPRRVPSCPRAAVLKTSYSCRFTPGTRINYFSDFTY
jgi:hypothetical protein